MPWQTFQSFDTGAVLFFHALRLMQTLYIMVFRCKITCEEINFLCMSLWYRSPMEDWKQYGIHYYHLGENVSKILASVRKLTKFTDLLSAASDGQAFKTIGKHLEMHNNVSSWKWTYLTGYSRMVLFDNLSWIIIPQIDCTVQFLLIIMST